MKADARCAFGIYRCCKGSWILPNLPNSRTKAQGMKLIACLRLDSFVMDHIHRIMLFAILNAVLSLGQFLDHASTQSASPSMASLGSGSVQSSSFPLPSAFSPASTPSTDTVWDLLESLDDTGSGDLAWTTDTANNTSYLTTNSSSLNSRDLVSFVDKVRSQRRLNVFFNSTDHGSYNLTIPGCLAADTILADVELPNGTFVTNATFATLIGSMGLPPEALYNYTLTMATKIYDEINATLSEVLCDGAAGATRQLLMPNPGSPRWRDPDNSEGFLTTFIVGLLGTTGIAWAGTRLAIAHHAPTRNISIDTEVAILAGTTAMEFIFITVMWRLQSVPKRWIGRIEAVVLNAFIMIGSKMLSGLKWIGSHSCFQTQTAETGLTGLLQRAQRSAQVFRFGYLNDPNAMSSQNLVEGALTNIGVGPVAQAAAQTAIELVEQGQIEGGAQPGANCGGSPS